MTSPLPQASLLLKETWELFRKNWQKTLNITIWFVYVGFIRFAIYASSAASPSKTLSFLALPIEIGAVVLTIWISIRLMRYVLSLDAGKDMPQTPEESSKAWSLVLPMLWIGILQSVILLGGLILFVIPGVYLAIALTFSNIYLLEHNLRGIGALAASRALVKGRWGSTFWRIIVGGLVFGGVIAIATTVLFWIFASLAGSTTTASGMTAWGTQPLVQGAMALVAGILQAIVTPLFIIYNVKIFRALKKTR